jgi:hypothetical protein
MIMTTVDRLLLGDPPTCMQQVHLSIGALCCHDLTQCHYDFIVRRVQMLLLSCILGLHLADLLLAFTMCRHGLLEKDVN